MRDSELMTAFSDVVLRRFRDLLKQVFQDAEEQLLRLSEGTEDRFFVSHAVDVVRGLRTEEFAIQLSFCRELKAKFEAFLRHQDASSELLIQQSGTDRSDGPPLPISTEMQIDPQTGRSLDLRLQSLTDRLYHFSPYAGLVKFRGNLPIAPGPVVEAFCRALEPVGLPIHKMILVILINELRRKLATQADEIYGEFEQVLISLTHPPAGVEVAVPEALPSILAIAPLETSLAEAECDPGELVGSQRIQREMVSWIRRVGNFAGLDSQAAAKRPGNQPLVLRKGEGSRPREQPAMHLWRSERNGAKWALPVALIAWVGSAFMAYRYQPWALLPGQQRSGEAPGVLGMSFAPEAEPVAFTTEKALAVQAQAQAVRINTAETLLMDGSGVPGNPAVATDSAGRTDLKDVPPLPGPPIVLSREEILRDIKIKHFAWLKTRSDNMLVMNIRIHNRNPIEAKDLELNCTGYSENLTDLGSLKIRLPQAIPSGTVVLLKDLRLGPAHRKTKRLRCNLL